jgi:hypothetical protein
MIACACTSIVFTRLPLMTVCLRWPPAWGAADAVLVAPQPWNTMESPFLPVFFVFILSSPLFDDGMVDDDADIVNLAIRRDVGGAGRAGGSGTAAIVDSARLN